MTRTMEQSEKRGRALKAQRALSNIGCIVFAAFAVLLMIAVVVLVLVLELKERSEEMRRILYILTGSFAGGAVVFALLGFLLGKLSQKAYERERDFLEQCDSENSFFVGETTLATFSEKGIRLHSSERKEVIQVPKSELRFFSVCTRHRARERGEWSVAIEIPARYLAKKPEPNAPPVLIQADGKERLYECLKRFQMPLLGEPPLRGTVPLKKKFTRNKAFSVPNAQKRKRALLFLALGVILFAGGFALAFTLMPSTGAVVAVLGALIGGRAILSFLRAKRTLAVFEEGLLWREENIFDSVFLKWDEIEGLEAEAKDGMPFLKVNCAYGSYHFINPVGAYEYLQEVQPEKCSK